MATAAPAQPAPQQPSALSLAARQPSTPPPVQRPSATPPPRPATPAPEAASDPVPTPAPPSDSDTPRRRRRAGAGGAVLVLGLGAGAAAGALAFLSLKPRCGDPADVLTCEIPTGGDLRQRAGVLGGAAALSLTGAVMGGLGTRALMRNTGGDGLAARTRRRRVATAAGATAVVAGIAGIAVGSALTGVGIRRATNSQAPEIDPTDLQGTRQNVINDVTVRVDGIRLAGTGLAVALASPTALAIGVALLRNRPARPEAARVTPALGPGYAGAAVTRSF